MMVLLDHKPLLILLFLTYFLSLLLPLQYHGDLLDVIAAVVITIYLVQQVWRWLSV